MTSCRKFCVSSLCKARKSCACRCEAIVGGTNPTLLSACEADCYTDPSHLDQYSSVEEYLCSRMDQQQLYNNLGYLCPGFDPMTGTAQGEAYDVQQSNINKSRNTIIMVIVVLVVIVAALFYYFMKTKK